jgi:4-cresol dehydrogenase (hydroxylating) flavoprotein subunit
MNVCSARFCRGLHVLSFNREDDDERHRAQACYRKMAEEVAKRGVFVGRAPIDFHDFHMSQTIPAFQNACSAVKRALDPNGVIAPGRYGIPGP